MLHKVFGVGGRSWFTDLVCHIDGVEIARGEEAVYGLKRDVVGIAKVGLVPTERLHGGIGSRTGRRRI